MAKEIYFSTDVTKFIVDKVIDGDKTITYVWEASYFRLNTAPDKGYQKPEDTGKPIRRIKKVEEDIVWNMEVFYPEWDGSKRFIRDDRYSLNYI